MSVEKYMQSIEKIAKESTYFEDFVAGVDPSGTRTFNNAFENKKNHKKHKAVGNIGGFVGGALSGVAIPAGLTAAGALALKKSNPDASKALMITAKGTMDALNPKKMVNYVKATPGIMKLQGDATKVTNGIGNISGSLDKIKSGNFNPSDLKSMVSSAKDALQSSSKLKSESAKIADKYFDGMSFGEGATRATTALTTLGTAALGGLTNATSANMQYNTSLKAKKRLDKENKGDK